MRRLHREDLLERPGLAMPRVRAPTARLHLQLIDAPKVEFLFEQWSAHVRRTMEFTSAVVIKDVYEDPWMSVEEIFHGTPVLRRVATFGWRTFGHPRQPRVRKVPQRTEVRFMLVAADVDDYPIAISAFVRTLAFVPHIGITEFPIAVHCRLWMPPRITNPVYTAGIYTHTPLSRLFNRKHSSGEQRVKGYRRVFSAVIGLPFWDAYAPIARRYSLLFMYSSLLRLAYIIVWSIWNQTHVSILDAEDYVDNSRPALMRSSFNKKAMMLKKYNSPPKNRRYSDEHGHNENNFNNDFTSRVCILIYLHTVQRRSWWDYGFKLRQLKLLHAAIMRVYTKAVLISKKPFYFLNVRTAPF